jgi:chromosome segregation ATPase
MADDILTATEAETLEARIKRLRIAEPVLSARDAEEGSRPFRGIARQIGLRADRRLPADQWFALCADALRAILPEGSDARRQFEKIASDIKRDGAIQAVNVIAATPDVKDLLRIAETTADLYTGTAQPEDLDLRIREAIRCDVWQAWPTRFILAAVLAFIGGTALWGFTAVEGLKVDLRQEMNTAEEALRADIRKLTDETSGVITRAREDLQLFKDEMAGIKGVAATELADFERSLADARTSLAEQRGEIADRIVNSSERIATLYAQVRSDLEGLDDRTQASFERALNDRTSNFNRKLEEFGERIEAMTRVADRTGTALVTLGNRAGAFGPQIQTLAASLDAGREKLVTISANIKSLEDQERGIAGRLDSLLSIYGETLKLGRENLSEANALLSGMRTLKDESAALHASIGTTKGSFDAEVEALHSELGITRNSVTGISESAASLGRKLDEAKQDLELRMSSFGEEHGKAMPRLTALTTEHLNPLETQASELDGRFRILEDRHAQIGEAIQGLSRQVADAGTRLTQASGTLSQTIATASALHDNVAAARNTLEADRTGIENIKSRSADLTAQLAALEATRDSLKPGYEQLLRQLGEAIDRTREALGEAVPLVEESRNARQAIAHLLSESGSDSRSIDELTAVLTRRHAELNEHWAGLDTDVGRRATQAIDALESKRAQIEDLLADLLASLVRQDPVIGSATTAPEPETPVPDVPVVIGTK